MKTTITKEGAHGLELRQTVRDKQGDEPAIFRSWSFTSAADAAKQSAEFADELAKPEHAELAAKLAELAPAADAAEG